MDDNSKVKKLDEINNDDFILDIGPKTIKKIKDIINMTNTIFGMVQLVILKIQILQMVSKEITKAIIKKNENDSIFSVVGGGDTIALINKWSNKRF